MDSIGLKNALIINRRLSFAFGCAMLALLLMMGTAFSQTLPNWVQTKTFSQPFTKEYLPNNQINTMTENPASLGILASGILRQTAWKLQKSGLTSAMIMAPLQQDLERQGFEILFECLAKTCGGFDFRFQLELFPEPHMHVDYNDYYYILARKNGALGSDIVVLLASRSNTSGYLHMRRISAESKDRLPFELILGDAVPMAQTLTPAKRANENLENTLISNGFVVLETVGFKSGGTDILVTDRSELSALAAFIKSRPEVLVTLVGHTDNLGSLEGNIKLSLERAQSLLKFMLTEFDVPPAQISAQGIGYLSPRDNNQTAEARAHNRRVEALINQAQN